MENDMGIRFSESKCQEMVNLYLTGEYSCHAIGKIHGTVGMSVWNVLKRHGVKVNKTNRKYTLDESYFDQIDTEEKAYFLGLLYADGCNYEKKNTISIGLQDKDILILENLIFTNFVSSLVPATVPNTVFDDILQGMGKQYTRDKKLEELLGEIEPEKKKGFFSKILK